MKYSATIIFLMSTILLSCSHNGKHIDTNSDKQKTTNEKFNSTWLSFVRAAKTSDLKTIKSLSTNCIYCIDCMEWEKINTDSLSESEQNKLSYVSIDHFIKEDYNLIFDSVLLARISDTSKVEVWDEGEQNRHFFLKPCIEDNLGVNNPNIKMISIRTVDPNPTEPWGSIIFEFIEDKHDFKFCGCYSIP